jgi:hypothetical protein
MKGNTMQQPELPPRALLPSGILHLVISYLWSEIRRHEANFAEKGESGIDREELEEYQRLVADLEHVYGTGAQVFEVRPWMYGGSSE